MGSDARLVRPSRDLSRARRAVDLRGFSGFERGVFRVTVAHDIAGLVGGRCGHVVELVRRARTCVEAATVSSATRPQGNRPEPPHAGHEGKTEARRCNARRTCGPLAQMGGRDPNAVFRPAVVTICDIRECTYVDL
jgi:hypothetical protein